MNKMKFSSPRAHVIWVLFAALLFVTLLDSDVTNAQSEYPFDRVFTTPAQRQLLDTQRRSHGGVKIDQVRPQISTDKEKTNYDGKEITLSGILLSEDGEPVYWINGKQAEKTVSGVEKDRQPQVVSQPNDSNKVSVQYESKVKSMKPGQVWILNENTVKEPYQIRRATSKTVLEDEKVMKAETVEQEELAPTPSD